MPSSRLITSYPIPPQYFFTCPPCSVRWKPSASKQVIRSTYICTEEGLTAKRRVTLFKDVVGGSGDTAPMSSFSILRQKEPIIHLTTTPSANSAIVPDQDKTGLDLLAITRDGNILCLDGETLAEKWLAPASTYLQGLYHTASRDFRVDLAQTSPATDTVAGLFNGKHDLFSLFPQKIESSGFNPDVLFIITSSKPSSTNPGERHMHILAIIPEDQSQQRSRQKIIPVTTFSIPRPSTTHHGPSTFRLDVESGSLEELCGGTLWTYKIHEDMPKLAHTLTLPEISSFVRLSESSVLAATSSTLEVYNPAYRSLQASAAIDLSGDSRNMSAAKGDLGRWELVTYFKKLETAVAISGRSLIAVQLEAPRSRKRKRRPQGLLISSIGRGLPQGIEPHKWSKAQHTSSALTRYLEGSLTNTYWKEWESDVAKADELLRAEDMAGFERLLAGKFKIELVQNESQPNGVHPDSADVPMAGGSVSDLPCWQWPSRPKFPRVDRRWVIYAISRVFSLQRGSEDGSGEMWMSLQLPQTNVLTYLAVGGHLSTPNLKSAFSDERETEDIDAVFGEQLPELLADIDPTFDLLFDYLAATKLGPIELLSSIRLIMRSLDLVQDPAKLPQKQIAPAEHEPAGDEEETIGMKLDRLEEDLAITERHLLDDFSTRERGLTVALGLLGAYPAMDTVQAIHRLFRPDETLSLIHVLRVELVRGGWTTRYLDAAHLDGEEELEPPPDGSIRLIADLLSRCIDSVGPGGWMVNDAILARSGDNVDSTGFFAALKLEVSAALEGIQEAVYLRGMLAEAVKYGVNVQKSMAGPIPQGKEGHKPVVMPQAQSQMLPLGLGAKTKVSHEKVISGGEIVQRSKRERGHLGSQKVGSYTLERIVI